jgi:DNA-directed RNA polymerase specialized sigma24 family protein
MSTKPSKSTHLMLEESDVPPFETTSSLVAKRILHVREIAFDHAFRVRRSTQLANEASQAITAKFLPLFKSNPEFLVGEKDRIDYTRATVSHWFLDRWDHEGVEEHYEGQVGAELEMDRNNEADAPTVEEQVALYGAEAAQRAELLARVRAIVGRLPRAMREVFEDRFESGLSVAETAKKRRRKEGTIKQQSHRVLAAIREAFGVTAVNPRQKKGNAVSTKPELVP